MRCVDLKFPEYREIDADDFLIGDLRDPVICREVIDRRFDEVYQLAADMGGAGTFSLESMMPMSCTILDLSI